MSAASRWSGIWSPLSTDANATRAKTAPGPRCLRICTRAAIASLAEASRRGIPAVTMSLASSSIPLRKPNGSPVGMNTSARSISSIPVLEIGPIFAASCTAALVSRQMLCASAERGKDGSMASRAPTRYAVTAAATIASGCLYSRALRKPSASAMRVAPRIPPSSMMSSVGAR